MFACKLCSCLRGSSRGVIQGFFQPQRQGDFKRSQVNLEDSSDDEMRCKVLLYPVFFSHVFAALKHYILVFVAYLFDLLMWFLFK